jgi:hypothetical protein
VVAFPVNAAASGISRAQLDQEDYQVLKNIGPYFSKEAYLKVSGIFKKRRAVLS